MLNSTRCDFTFSDTIAGYVDRLPTRTTDIVHAARRPTAASSTSSLTRHDLRRGDPQPRRALRRRDAARCATCSTPAASCSPTASSTPRADGLHVRGQAHRLRRPRRARVRLRAPGLVGRRRSASSPTSTSAPQFPDGADRLPQLPHAGSRSTASKLPGTRQETDTISRLVYGFATRLPADRRGPLPGGGRAGHRVPARPHAPRRRGRGHRLLVPRHRHVAAASEQKLLASEFGDDYDAIPAYEQIYALAGPTQTYRITGDPRILSDIEKTVELFDRFYLDREQGGYFSHIDPVTLDPAQRVARPQPGPQELELGRRPRARPT